MNTKLFCNCDSMWVVCLKDLADKQVTGHGVVCNVCLCYKWIDADYENMMFDLKEMNRC